MTIRLLRMSAATALLIMLAACSDDNDDSVTEVPEEPEMRTFEVSVFNLSANQPLSPIAVIASDGGKLWHTGEAASDGLEALAEGGDNSVLIGADSTLESTSGDAPLGAGNSEMLTLSLEAGSETSISVASMLVNTNDAFSGITGVDLTTWAVGETNTYLPAVYDAGTEENTEMAGTIPGPADGGEGVSEGREALDAVTMHSGVVTADDGLPDSVLDSSHRFANPVMKIIISRVE